MVTHNSDHELHDTQNRYARTTKLPSNPRRALQEMMETIDNLRTVYEQETDALSRSDVKTFMELQDRKIESARIYQDNVAQLLARKDDMKNLEPAAREKLEKMQKEFSELAARNMKALEKMQKTMDRFSGTLRDAARDAVKKDRSHNYTAHGRMDLDNAKRLTTGTISETA
ncbi:MAG: flagellar protein FlgN [Alphaproteobacteria bacterium]